MTDVAKKVQDYKDSLKQKAEHLIIKGFPEKIVKLNDLLETSHFCNRDLSDVHQDLNIPVPLEAIKTEANSEPNAKRQRMESSEVSSNSMSTVDGTKVYVLPNGSVPCNKPLSDLIHLVKPHIRELVEDSNLLTSEIHCYLEVPTVIEEVRNRLAKYRTRLAQHVNPLAVQLTQNKNDITRLKRHKILELDKRGLD